MATRRTFLKLSSMGGALLAGLSSIPNAFALKGEIKLKEGGIDFSPKTGKKRESLPSACWQCVHRCNIVGYVEDGRLVKIEGDPNSIRNRGKICSKGQAGINQLYDPDRILYPMKRVGKRGEGKWKRVSWEEALTELTEKLKKLRDAGEPEKFMFHYGRMKGSDSSLTKSFLSAYGTKTIGNHTSICEAAKWTAQELTWGKHYDSNNVEHANMILVFGCNLLETHTSHMQIAQRTINAITERNVKMITFDVRHSNTAAKSSEWIPIYPGTDLAVLLALTHVVLRENLYDRDFMETWTNVTPEQLKAHYKQYTPQWAAKLSGVSAEKIERIALEYAKAKPGTLVTYRGAVSHYNGVDAERAAKTLDAILGYIDVKGGTCVGVGASWKYPKPKTKGLGKKLKIIDGFKGEAVLPTHHVSHRVLGMIKDGSNGRPDVYMSYCYAPAYANGDVKDNIEILKDETLMPYHVNVNPFYDETAALADLILPDVTYLERLSWDNMVCYEQIPVHYIRQPLVKPLGESRQFQDVAIELAKRMNLDLGVTSTMDFLKQSCKKTGIDFDTIMKNGTWVAPNAKPNFRSYAKELPAKKYSGKTILFDEETGVYWNWKKSSAKSEAEARKKGYTKTKNAYKGYVGQRIGDKVYAGFKPDKVNKSGKFDIYSPFLKEKGVNPLPTWTTAPELLDMAADEMILTTYKVMNQIHSRSANCKWLTELYHDNPAWIHPKTAAKKGIKNGAAIKITSPIGEIVTHAHITEGIHPDVIAISHHCGHWEYGRYASGKTAPEGRKDSSDRLIWWTKNGVHPNWIIPNASDPVAGALRYMETVVQVKPV